MSLKKTKIKPFLNQSATLFRLSFCVFVIMAFLGGKSWAQTTGPNNVISWMPNAFFPYQKIALGYERVLTDQLSVKLRFAPMIPRSSGFPGSGIVERVVDDSVKDTGLLGLDFETGGFDISPELRFYPGSNSPAPRGFYLAPFFRYNKVNADVTQGMYIDEEDGDYIGDFTGDFKTTVFGLKLGVQALINDQITLDFGLGFGYARNSWDMVVSNILDATPADYQENAENFQREIEDAIGGTFVEDWIDYEVKFSDNDAGLELSGGLPILNFEFGIGYAF